MNTRYNSAAKHLLMSLFLITVALGGTSARAASTWNGNGTPSVQWSTNANWASGTAPANSFSDTFTFAGTNNVGTLAIPLNNDRTGGTATSITFNSGSGAFFISGNPITLGGNIVNNEAVNAQALNMGLTLSADRTFTIVSGGRLVLGGAISRTAASNTAMNIAGLGTVSITGTWSNVNNGIQVQGGSILNFNGATATGRTLLISRGTISVDAGSILDFSNQGASFGNVNNANDDTFYNQTGGTLTFGNLTTSNGATTNTTMNITGGTLNVTGTLFYASRGRGTIGTNMNLSGTSLVNVANFKFGDTGTFGNVSSTITINPGAEFRTAASFDWGNNGGDVRNNTIEINGGKFSTVATIVTNAASNAVVNFANGGTFEARNAGTDFFNGLDAINIKDGGGIINTNGNDVTINKPLLNFSGATTASLTKSGAGALTISGNSTYTGTTTLSGGSLYLNGTNATSAIGVAAGSTFGGSGSAPATAIVSSGAAIEPGSNGTTLSLSGLTFNGSASMKIGRLANFASSPALRVTGTGALIPAGGNNSVTINIASLSGALIGVPYKLIGYTGALGGSGLAAFQIGTLPQNTIATLSSNGSEILLTINSMDSLIWTGSVNSVWDTTTQNWKRSIDNVVTNFRNTPPDAVLFDNSGANTTVNLSTLLVTPFDVTFANSINYTLQGTFGIGGTTGLSKLGAGNLTITSPNSFTGSSNLGGGLLNLGVAEVAGTSGPLGRSAAVNPGSITMSGSTLQHTATNTFDYSGRFGSAANQAFNIDTNGQNVTWAAALNSSGGTLTKSGTGTLTLAGNNPFSGAMTISGGTLQVGNGGAGASIANSSGITNNGILTFNQSDTTAFGQVISGTGSLIKTGGGTLTLTGLNLYSGGTTLSGGTLNINSASAIGTSTFTIPGNTFNNNSGAAITLSTNNPMTWSGNPTFTGTNDLNMGTGAVTMTTNPTVTVNGSTLTVGGNIGGVFGINKAGVGALTLNGASTYSGTAGTTVNGGTLNLNGTHTGPAPFALRGNSTVNLNAGAVETITGAQQFTLSNQIAGTTLMNVAGTLNIFTTNGQDTIIAGNTVGGTTGTLRILNGGVINITETGFRLANVGVNPATGILTMDAGSTMTLDTTDLGNGFLVQSGGTLAAPTGTVNLNGGVLTSGRILKVAGSGVGVFNFNGGTLRPGLSSTNFLNLIKFTDSSRNANSRANVRDGGAIIDTNTFNITIPEPLVHSVIGGDAAIDGGLTKNGAGTLTLTGTSTYTGPTTINTGTLQIGSAGTSGTLGTGAVRNDAALVFNRTDTLAVANAISGSGTVTQAGTGTTTLSANNTYSGLTTVSAGKLYLNGTNASSGISVAPAATLGGTGSAATATMSAASVLEPGVNGSGQFTLAGLAFNGTAAVNVGNIGSYTSQPAVRVTGNGALIPSGASNSITINIASAAGAIINTPYKLIGYVGSIGGTGFPAFTLGTLPPRSTATLANIGSEIVVTFTSIDSIIWTGNVSSVWESVLQNWKLSSNSAATNYISGDSVNFDDSTANTTVNLSSALVTPSTVTFGHSIRNYTLQGSFGIGGNTGLSKSGTGTLTLASPNSFTGVTTLNGGILNLGIAEAVGTSGPLGRSAAINPGFIVLNGGTLQHSASNANDYSGRFSAANTQVYNIDTNGQNVTWSSALNSLGGSLNKSGVGTLTLTANNSYSGPTTIGAGGTLQIGNGTATGDLGNTTGTIVNDGTLLFNRSSGTITLNNNITGIGNMVFQDGSYAGTVTLNGNYDCTGGIALSGSAVNPSGILNVNGTLTTPSMTLQRHATLNISAGATATLSTGTGSFIMDNSGGSGSGTTNVAGILNLSGTGGTAIGNANNAAVALLRVLSGGVLNVTNGSFRMAGSANAGNNWALSGTLTLDPGSTVTMDNFDDTPNNNGFSIQTGGTLTTSQGFVHLNGGTLTTGRVIRTSGKAIAVFNFNGGILRSTISSPIFLNLTSTSGGHHANSRANVRDGGAKIDSNGFTIAIPEPLVHSNIGGDAAIDGGLTLNDTAVTKGTLALSGANTYTGNTVVTAGTLQFGNAAAIPTGAGRGDVVLNAGATVAGTLDVFGFNSTINGLSGTTGAVVGQVINSTVGSTGTLSVGNNNGSSAFSGTFKDNTGVGGTLALTKVGTGTLTLSGSSSHSGLNTINGGTLEIANSVGSATGTGEVRVVSGKLAGTGMVSGPVNVNSGGTFAPGLVAAPGYGTLTTGTLTLAAGSFANFDLITPDNGVSGSGDDEVVVNGNLVLGGTLTISGASIQTGVYHLFSFTGSASGAFSSIVVPNGVAAVIRLTPGSADLLINAPVLASIADKTVNEASTLAFSASATPTDITRTFVYSISNPVPPGAVINPLSGAFSWTPNDGPAQSQLVTIRAADTLIPGLYVEQSFTVTINNVVPTATFSNGGAVNEGSTGNVSFTGQNDVSSVDTTAGFRYSYDFNNDGTFDLGGNNYATAAANTTVVVPAIYLDDNFNRTVRARIWDKDDGFTEYTTTITVNNVAPTATFTNSGDVTEGTLSASVAFNGAFDPSPVDSVELHYAFDLDNDGLFDIGGNTYLQSVSSSSTVIPTAFLNDGPRDVEIRARVYDKDNGFTEYFTTIHVNNVNPVAALSVPANTFEGGTTSFSVSAQFDPSGPDTNAGFRYSYDFNYNGVTPSFDLGGNSYASASFDSTPDIPANQIVDGPATQTILARIWDKDDGFTDYTETFEIANVAPALSSLSATIAVENGTTVLTGTLSDPGVLDAFTVVIDWMDGTIDSYEVLASATGSQNFSFSHTYLDDDPTNTNFDNYAVSITVTDNDGDSGSAIVFARVNDANPVVTIPNGLAPHLLEHTTTGLITLATFTDAGKQDTHTVVIDWGDGTPLDTGATLIEPAGATPGSIQANHLFDDGPGIRTVSVTVSDDDNGSGSATFNVFVDNVAPIAIFQRPDAGSSTPMISVEFVNQFDPSNADTAAGFLYSYDWDNDGVFDVALSQSSSMTIPPQYLLSHPNHVVHGRIIDKDGGRSDYYLQQPFFASRLLEVTFDLGAQSSYTLVATALPAPNYSIEVVDLPAGVPNLAALGLSFDGVATISGVPIVGGMVTLHATASNFAGTETVDLIITIKRPVNSNNPKIISEATANPNPCITGTPVEFSIVATDADGDVLSYYWQFGDGTNARGRVVTHTYSTPAKYVVTCSISDGKNDGTFDDLNLVVAAGTENTFDVQQAKLSFDFRKPEKSTLYVTGYIPVPSGPLAGVIANVSITGTTYAQAFQFDSKGNAGDTMSLFSVKTIQTGTGTSRAKFVFSLKSTNGVDPLQPSLFQKIGGIFPAQPQKAGEIVAVPLVITIGAQATQTNTIPMLYKVIPNRSGKGQFKRK